jgi:hypothetical protein
VEAAFRDGGRDAGLSAFVLISKRSMEMCNAPAPPETEPEDDDLALVAWAAPAEAGEVPEVPETAAVDPEATPVVPALARASDAMPRWSNGRA